MKSTSKGGRPASYTAGQLDEAITTAEDREPAITWEHVRAVLIEEHGVSPTIRGESLQKVVEPLLMERQRTREDALISRVPEGTQTAIADAVAAMGRLMSLTCGQHVAQSDAAYAARSDEEARQRIELVRRMVELEVERDKALTKVQTLEAELAAKGTAIASRDRQLEKVQKRVIRLEGMIEGRRLALAPPAFPGLSS